jgi:hypothetical protein
MTTKPATAKVVQASIDDVITECRNYSHGFGIGELLANLVQRLSIAGQAFAPLRRAVGDRYFDDILVEYQHPSFLDLIQTIPFLLRAVDKSSSFFDKLMQRSCLLIAPWTCIPVFMVYMECLEIRLRTLSNEKQRSAALVKSVNGFFNKNVNLDCYEYEMVLDAWLQLMRKYLTFQQSRDLIIQLFVQRVRRFFPAFVELARTVKAILQSPSEAVRGCLPGFLQSAEAAGGSDEYKQAIQLLKSLKSVQMALNPVTS